MGGWLMAAAGVLLVLFAIIALRNRRPGIKAVSAAAVLLMLSSCSNGPQPIKLNVDNCYSCKMSISDVRFGAEVVSRKGKVWKFDDVHCLLSFLKGGELQKADIKEVYFVRFDGGHELLTSEKAFLLQSDALHSPMAGNIAAFTSKGDVDLASRQLSGQVTTWQEIRP
jgi:copper chaperone NosL